MREKGEELVESVLSEEMIGHILRKILKVRWKFVEWNHIFWMQVSWTVDFLSWFCSQIG